VLQVRINSVQGLITYHWVFRHSISMSTGNNPLIQVPHPLPQGYTISFYFTLLESYNYCHRPKGMMSWVSCVLEGLTSMLGCVEDHWSWIITYTDVTQGFFTYYILHCWHIIPHRSRGLFHYGVITYHLLNYLDIPPFASVCMVVCVSWCSLFLIWSWYSP